MLLDLFKDFKKILTGCASDIVQNAIWLEVQKYCQTHHLDHSGMNERYHAFYETVRDETKQPRIAYNRSIEAERKADETKKKAKAGSSENIPDYSNGVNSRLRQGIHDKDFAFAIYFWFHAFARDLSYAQTIDEKILEDYPELTGKLKEIKVKILAARPIKTAQSNRELTEEQCEKLTDQIERLGYDGLISIWFKGVSLSEENGRIEGEFYCKDGGAYLECDGLDYDFSIALTKVVVDFVPKGVVLEGRKILDVSTGKIKVYYYHGKRSPTDWKIIIESEEGTSALKGGLLARSTNGVLFYTKPDDKTDESPVITAKHILEGNHIKITHTGDEECDDSKKRLISRKLKRIVLKVCGEQITTCVSEFEEKPTMRKSAYD